MHPPARRVAARKHALQFVADYLRPWVEKQSFDLPDRPSVDAAREAGSTIQAFALDRLGEHAPAWSGFLHKLDAVATRLEQRAATETAPDEDSDDNPDDASREDDATPTADAGDGPAGSPSPETGRPASPRPGDGSPDASVPGEPQPTVAVREPGGELSDTEWRRVVVQRAAAVRETDLSRTEPYRLLRLLRWGSLSTAPPSSDGKTQLPPPDKDQRAALTGLAGRDDPKKLLRAAEQAFQAGNFWFWLDLQRMEVEAAESLGPSFAGVVEALRADLTGLLRRFPELPSLSFRDGTPFADASTQGWLESLTAPDAADAPASDGEDALEDAMRRARTLLGTETLDAAIRELDDASRDGSARSRFRRDLYSARLCIEAGRLDVAVPLLEDLDAQIAAHRLDRWEPSLAVQTWTRLYTCYVRIDAGKTAKTAGTDRESHHEAARETYRKICRVDAASALSLPPRPD
jgi:type VI secretion system protein VasJ